MSSKWNKFHVTNLVETKSLIQSCSENGNEKRIPFVKLSTLAAHPHNLLQPWINMYTTDIRYRGIRCHTKRISYNTDEPFSFPQNYIYIHIWKWSTVRIPFFLPFDISHDISFHIISCIIRLLCAISLIARLARHNIFFILLLPTTMLQ